MLILSRRCKERVRIGNDIRVEVSALSGEEVGLTIEVSGKGKVKGGLREDDVVTICDNITVMVIKIYWDTERVDLGFKAPPSVEILREELYLKRESLLASGGQTEGTVLSFDPDSGKGLVTCKYTKLKVPFKRASIQGHPKHLDKGDKVTFKLTSSSTGWQARGVRRKK